MIGLALYALDLLPGGFYVLGGILGVLFVAESVASWRSHTPDEHPEEDGDIDE